MLNEEKVTEYRGYSIYRVEDKDLDDFEVWKDGKCLGSFDTEEDALEFIKGELGEMKKVSSVQINKILEGASVLSVLKEDDQEYWDYVHTYGSHEEKEKAADYFDVTPSAFEETYADFFELDKRDECWDEQQEMDEAKSEADPAVELKKFETDDYQHRGGNYPRSDKPDTIQVTGTEIECDFKNTSQSSAERWLSGFLKQHGFTFTGLDSCQDGDYDNDWVRAWATVTGFAESSSVTEDFANDSFGYDLATTIRYELGDAARENVNKDTGEGLYEYLFDGSDEQLVKFERSIKRLQKKFPEYSFETKTIERANGDTRYLLNVKCNSAVKESKALMEGQKVYYGTLYRFGYDLNCIDKSKKACEQAIMDEYEEVFKRQNDGLDPRESFDRDDKKSDYDIAKSEIEWNELEFGKVAWR
jgi:hypothetical protein